LGGGKGKYTLRNKFLVEDGGKLFPIPPQAVENPVEKGENSPLRERPFQGNPVEKQGKAALQEVISEKKPAPYLIKALQHPPVSSFPHKKHAVKTAKITFHIKKPREHTSTANTITKNFKR